MHEQIVPKLSPNINYLSKTTVKVAGVAGLEPVTSAVTGQRSNQLSYTPAKGEAKTSGNKFGVKSERRKSVRATDAKEVGVGNPAEETCYRPNDFTIANRRAIVNRQAKLFSWLFLNRWLGSRATANRKLLPLAFALGEQTAVSLYALVPYREYPSQARNIFGCSRDSGSQSRDNQAFLQFESHQHRPAA